jgi:hypothetical protein
MKKLTTLFIPFLLFAFSSCEKVIEPGELPDQEARLVMNSIIFNDSLIKVEVSSSKSILNNKAYKFIDNAICALFENGVFKEHLTLIAEGVYSAMTKAVAGKEYKIQVNAAGFDQVEGKTITPNNFSFGSIERYDTLNSKFWISHNYNGVDTSYNVYGGTKLKFRIKDNPNELNTYGVEPVIYAMYDSSGVEKYRQLSGYIQGNRNLGFSEADVYGSTLMVNDENHIGNDEIPVDFLIDVYSFEPINFKIKRLKVSLRLYNFSNEYYRYQKTLIEQRNIGAALFAEPVLVYSNVSSGMGIVAAANTNLVFVYDAKLN